MDFKRLPKIELHAHLTGSISRECLHEIWRSKSTTLADPLLEMPSDKFDYDLETFFPLFSRYIYALCNDLPSITSSTNAVLHAFHADGVVYLELRTTPRAVPAAGITKDDYVRTVLGCIAAFNASHPDMRTRLILSIDRRDDPATAQHVVALAWRYRAQGVVGIDLCGDPSVGDVAIFAPAFAAARAAALKITLHFAEAPASASRAELECLLAFRPDRLGHVIHVPEDLRREIVRRGIGVELCLSCNVHAGMIEGSFGDHHFGWYHEAGAVVVLCTDDIGVFLSPLSNEYALVAEHFRLEPAQIGALVQRTVGSIFGDEADRLWLGAVVDEWVGRSMDKVWGGVS